MTVHDGKMGVERDEVAIALPYISFIRWSLELFLRAEPG
jgi:hypothetical protein